MQDEEEQRDLERLGNKQLLLQNIDYALDMFLIYALTLSIFPGFLSEDTGSHSLGTWYVLKHNVTWCQQEFCSKIWNYTCQVCTGFDCNVQCV